MKTSIFIFFLTFFISNLKAQDFSLYYKYIDSIHYYQATGNHTKALELYSKCFDQYNGFYEDYENAICYKYNLTKKVDDTLLMKAFQAGSSFWMLYMDAHKFVPFPFFKTYKLYLKHKTKKTNRLIPILRMAYKDQKFRKRNFKGINSDSLNAQKLIYWAKHEPERFNRNKSGFIAQQLLGVLIFHDGWRYLQPIQKELMEFTRKGWLNRETMAYLIERASGENTFFKIQGDSLHPIIDSSFYYCGTQKFFYSNLNNFFMGVDRQENIRYFQPSNPIISILEMEELRSYLLLPSTEMLYLIHPNYKKITTEEFCGYITKRY